MTTSSGQQPQRIAQYRLIEQIGAGAMGVVWRAHDERLDRDVAVKVIATADQGDADARRRFRTEAIALTRLNHPNIATVFDFATETVADGSERDYVVMELIPGQTLDERLGRKPLQREEFLSLATQLVKGIAAAHEAGVLHRDLKPANVLITPEGHLKILDFGLAKMTAPVQEGSATVSMSVPGTIVGTIPYMSPEQLRAEEVDARTDIYAAGAVLYEMAAGRRAFEGAGTELMNSVLNDLPSVPSGVNRRLDAATDAIVLKALEKRRELRYQSAREMLVDLERMRSGSVSGYVKAPKEISKGAAGKLVAVAVLLALVAVMIPLVKRALKGGAAGGIKSLAVLPLENLSGDPAQTYFSEAMTEELTSEMASLHSLRVISRTSASRYRDGKKSVPEIANELGVDALIEGSVLRAANKVRITVQLIDGKTDRHLWSRSYERVADDVVTLQREVATAIAREIRVQLTPEERQHLASAATKNPQAYEAYLSAQYRLETAIGVKEDSQEAIAAAEQAIALDPDFAEAYVTLAQALMTKVFSFDGGKAEIDRAFGALNKALSLDPNMAEAYATKGNLYYNQYMGFQISNAIANYRKAAVLNPNLAQAHHNLGSELTHAGLHDEAATEFRKCLELDPHFTGAKGRLARALWQSNRFQEAEDTYRKFDIRGFERMAVLSYLGRQREAWEMGRLAAVWNQDAADSDIAAAEALLNAREGKTAEAERRIAAAASKGMGTNHFHHAAFLIAAAYAEMAKPEEAVKWLRYDAENGMPNYPLFKDNPSMKKIAGNKDYEAFMAELKPRWQQLAKEIGRN